MPVMPELRSVSGSHESAAQREWPRSRLRLEIAFRSAVSLNGTGRLVGPPMNAGDQVGLRLRVGGTIPPVSNGPTTRSHLELPQPQRCPTGPPVSRRAGYGWLTDAVRLEA